MTRKPGRKGKKLEPVKRVAKTCQGDMCLVKLTTDWYEFQPSGMKTKLVYCSECLEHAIRQERQLF